MTKSMQKTCFLHIYALAILALQISPSLSKDNAAPAQNSWEIKPVDVTGGDFAKPGQFPWQVLIRSGAKLSDGQFYVANCGGSIIWPGWILTAAHCLYLRDEASDKLKLATVSVVYIGDDVTWTRNSRFEVKKLLPHPGYNGNDNDIALLQLTKKAGAGRWIGVLKPEDEEKLAHPGTVARVAGWGATFDYKWLKELGKQEMYTKRMWEDFSSPGQLSFVDVPIKPLSYCKEVGDGVTDNFFCAGGIGGKDSCYGDSGGALVVPAETKAGFVQVGIVSRGVSGGAICGQPGYPSLYTRVSHYNDWLARTIREHQ